MGGVVYILENLDAQRIKVGMTINAVELRLRDANDMWQEHKVTCQICGSRRLVKLNWNRPKLMLDTAAPFREVFRCSAASARAAVERALEQLGTLRVAAVWEQDR